MKVAYKAVIMYEVTKSHPDIDFIKNPDETQKLEDTYMMDSDNFFGEDHMIDHIKSDLALVAGGGYNTNHIYGVRFDIKKVSTITK